MILQPDVCYAGGITELRLIAGMAEAYYLPIAPHNPQGPCSLAASLQIAASIPNFLIQEDMLADVPWRWEVVESALKTEDGYWLPCDEPGLGIKPNKIRLVVLRLLPNHVYRDRGGCQPGEHVE